MHPRHRKIIQEIQGEQLTCDVFADLVLIVKLSLYTRVHYRLETQVGDLLKQITRNQDDQRHVTYEDLSLGDCERHRQVQECRRRIGVVTQEIDRLRVEVGYSPRKQLKV